MKKLIFIALICSTLTGCYVGVGGVWGGHGFDGRGHYHHR